MVDKEETMIHQRAQHQAPTPYHQVEFRAVYAGFPYNYLAQEVYVACRIIGHQYREREHRARISAAMARAQVPTRSA